MMGLSFFSRVDWGSYTFCVAKTVSKKIEALIRFTEFLSLENAHHLNKSIIRSCMKCCCHLCTGTPDCYLEMLDELQKRECRTVGPTLATLLPLLIHFVIVER